MNISVTADQVARCVESDYGLRLLRPLEDMPPGVHSRAWLAYTDDGDWVVKVSDPESDPPESLAAQSELYAFLNSRGLHTPVVRRDHSDHHCRYVALPHARYPVTVMRHHRLQRMTAESVTPKEMRRVGILIAQLHETMEDFVGRDAIVADREKSLGEWGQQGPGFYTDLVDSLTGRLFNDAERSWIRGVDAELVAYLDANFPDLATLSHAVLHGDLAFEHLLLLPDQEIYLFDFGDLCWGPVAHELGQLLRGFMDSPITFARWAQLRQWLIASYRTRRTLTEADVAAIDLFMINRVVAQSNYILELYADTASAHGAEAIKRSYRLAENLLQGRHRTEQ